MGIYQDMAVGKSPEQQAKELQQFKDAGLATMRRQEDGYIGIDYGTKQWVRDPNGFKGMVDETMLTGGRGAEFGADGRPLDKLQWQQDLWDKLSKDPILGSDPKTLEMAYNFQRNFGPVRQKFDVASKALAEENRKKRETEQRKEVQKAFVSNLAMMAPIAMPALGIQFVGATGVLGSTGNVLFDTVLNGAVKGGIVSTVSGGDPLKGALVGGITGGVNTVLPDTGSSLVNGAMRGVTPALLSGNPNAIITGAIGGGIKDLGDFLPSGGVDMNEFDFIAYDAAQLAEQGLSRDQIVSTLESSGVDPFMAADVVQLLDQGISPAQISQVLAGGYSDSSSGGLINPNVASAIANKLIGGGGGGNSGSNGGSDKGGFNFNIGDMITGGANLAYQNKLAQEGIDFAKQTAEGGKFTPYSINSGMGRSYVDPATGEMVSELAPEWQGAQDTLLNSFEGNMQYASMDPMEASQYAYNMGSSLNAYGDEQNRLGLENRLLSQGMLGSTGGANQMRSLYDSMNQRDLGREAQSLQLGQGMLDSYQRRGLAAYQPAWNTQQQFASQIGQSGTLGGQQAAGNRWGLAQVNDAYSDRTKMLSAAATRFANNPQVGSGINNILGGGSTGSGNNIINSGVNSLMKYFGGGGTFTQDGNTWKTGTDTNQFEMDPNYDYSGQQGWNETVYDGNTWADGVDYSQFYMD